MGPFPHAAQPAQISRDNPAGTDGFAFVEFASDDTQSLRTLFTQMGFIHAGQHQTRNIEVWQQGQVYYLINAEAGSHGGDFSRRHGPCAPSMGWCMVDPEHAFEHAQAKGAKAVTQGRALEVPAIEGIGGSLLYFLPSSGLRSAQLPFNWLAEEDDCQGVGLYYLDHLTHNVQRGRMDHWSNWYAELFGFKQIRFFDIEGRLSGLHSRAMTSACGKIRIPINESADAHSQIEEYLHAYGGEGIQHIACGSDDIYQTVNQLRSAKLAFMPAPPDRYYEQIDSRVSGHQEPLALLREYGILIDGEGVVDGGDMRVLLQIFSKTCIGPIFFEFIQRKGDDGFGEGNFKALFQSIEDDQVARGVLHLDQAS